MKFRDFIYEESPNLEPLHTNYFERLGKKVGYDKKHKDIFPKGQDRLVIPLPGKSVTSTLSPDLKTALKDTLNNLKSMHGMKVEKINWKEGIVYIANEYGLSKKYDIEGLLGHPDIGAESKKERLLYTNMWNYSAWRRGPKFNNLAIVISRAPNDIGGMGTCVGWKSCMNLYTGKYNRYTKKDVKEGTLIAWLIDVKDKEIEYPIGRILIKGYLPEQRGKKHLVASSDTYGDFPDFAQEAVKSWLLSVQKSAPGTYKFNKKLYKDSGDTDTVKVK